MNVHDKRIVFENADGSVAIAVPVGPMLEGESEAAYLTRIANKAKPAGSTKKGVIEKTELPYADPGDATVIKNYVLDEATGTVSEEAVPDKVKAYRPCWRWDGNAVVVDAALETAERNVKVRTIRDRLLVLSDGPWAREQEQGGPNQADHKTYRQSLRDIPQDYPDATDVAWPTKP